MRAAHISHGPRGFTCKVFSLFLGKRIFFVKVFPFRQKRPRNHVAGRREEAGIPAEEAGGHDQRSQMCHKPGKFAGKSSRDA